MQEEDSLLQFSKEGIYESQAAEEAITYSEAVEGKHQQN